MPSRPVRRRFSGASFGSHRPVGIGAILRRNDAARTATVDRHRVELRAAASIVVLKEQVAAAGGPAWSFILRTGSQDPLVGSGRGDDADVKSVAGDLGKGD